ncbi:hypothetical protein CSOJ01_13302 [Colletotrichum sojae]|uniref:Uncharacterized protein n=1 Tax=Colletotrichum sojae TaxID=2175907 RepID=A0A8H6ITE3_9PEZI|nr:hypothetical protein CSOJ01_13302 [Colletotrichum sojae]
MHGQPVLEAGAPLACDAVDELLQKSPRDASGFHTKSTTMYGNTDVGRLTLRNGATSLRGKIKTSDQYSINNGGDRRGTSRDPYRPGDLIQPP